MPKLIFLAALVSMFAVLACSEDSSAPAAQPTLETTSTPTASPTPTATPQSTATPIPEEPVAGTKGLAPLNLDDPEAFLSGLSAEEQSCLTAGNLGVSQIATAMSSTSGAAEGDAILDCLEDVTVLRLFLTTLVGQVEPFSQETSMCIREGFVPLDLRGLLAPAVAGFTPGNSLALSMAALNVSLVCMNDEEWDAYAPRLGMKPEDKEVGACLFEELGGPAKLVEAMRDASFGEPSEAFLRAAETCGLEGTPPSQ